MEGTDREWKSAIFFKFKTALDSMAKKFALVRWLEEKSVGVMPISSAQNPEELYVGCVTKMKWTRGKKLYDVEILKLSGKCYKYKIEATVTTTLIYALI